MNIKKGNIPKTFINDTAIILEEAVRTNNGFVKDVASNLLSILIEYESSNKNSVDFIHTLNDVANANRVDDLIATTDNKRIIRRKLRRMKFEILNNSKSKETDA